MTDLPEDERWLDGYEGRYSVHRAGYIKSYVYAKPKILVGGTVVDRKNRPNCEGYKVVCLKYNGKSKTISVHRAVATAFIPNPDGKPTVNHVDGNKHNNDVSNLEWATYSENSQHMHKTIDFGKRIRHAKGFTCVEDYVDYIKTGDTRGYLKYDNKRNLTLDAQIPDEAWVLAGVPKEILDLVKKKGSYLEHWNYIITAMNLCNSNEKLSVIEYLLGVDYTFGSQVRNRRRFLPQRKLYEKYGNNPDYLKNYKEYVHCQPVSS